MSKHFNTAGPCFPDEHYMLPAQERCRGLMEIIDQKHYFVLHAARQSGKTTLLLDLVKQLNDSGKYYAMYCSLESVQGIVEPEKGIPAIINELRAEVEFHALLSSFKFAESVNQADFSTSLRVALAHFCQEVKKPLVILFDEVDCLSNGTLIAFLRQLRYGYISRDRIPFVHSVALVGMRNIRDYKSRIRDDRETLGSASPFNIVSETLTLRNFTQAEIVRLYTQHTEQTGQAFASEVTELVYRYTQGQPWLVSAIAREIVERILEFDYTQQITPEHVDQAVQNIILRRDTHIDSLLERLKEARVRKIVEPVIIGKTEGLDRLDDDYQYTLDLGLLREFEKKLIPSNPIYTEIMIRVLSSRSQMEMDNLEYPPSVPAYLVNGRFDMRRLLGDFQAFWRENSDIWIERYEYKEAAPHLILQAFLQRILNGGGAITREMAAGSGRLDLCVHYQGARYPIELKLRYSDKTLQEGKAQLARYMEKLGCAEGWLLIFDRRPAIAWDQRIFWETVTENGKTIHIVGC